MPSYSKAPRGLFVLVEVGRVFTATAISPSRGSGQLLTRDAIRARRNLPDKELRYRRTVHIVTLDRLITVPYIAIGVGLYHVHS